jgi:hypothetical protein
MNPPARKSKMRPDGPPFNISSQPVLLSEIFHDGFEFPHELAIEDFGHLLGVGEGTIVGVPSEIDGLTADTQPVGEFCYGHVPFEQLLAIGF